MVSDHRARLIELGAIRGALHAAEDRRDVAQDAQTRAAAIADAAALRSRLSAAEAALPASLRRLHPRISP